MSAEWSVFTGVLVYVIAFIVSTIYYYKFRRWAVIAYIMSISTYIFSFFYMWDVLMLSKNLILFLLVCSVVLMFLAAKHFKSVKFKAFAPRPLPKKK